ncbi:MAG: hypothetical protein ACREEU_05980 [Acetobacteraceae bacterium]
MAGAGGFGVSVRETLGRSPRVQRLRIPDAAALGMTARVQEETTVALTCIVLDQDAASAWPAERDAAARPRVVQSML